MSCRRSPFLYNFFGLGQGVKRTYLLTLGFRFFLVPFVLVFQFAAHYNKAFMTFLRYCSRPDSFYDGTVLFLCVRAFCISAFSYVWFKFSEGIYQVVIGKKVKSFKIQYAKAGSIGEESGSRGCLYSILVNASCRLLTS